MGRDNKLDLLNRLQGAYSFFISTHGVVLLVETWNHHWYPVHFKTMLTKYYEDLFFFFEIDSTLTTRCDVHYDFRIKTMFDSSLLPVVCRRAHVLFTLFVFTSYSGVQHMLCCVFSLVCVPIVVIFFGLSGHDYIFEFL